MGGDRQIAHWFELWISGFSGLSLVLEKSFFVLFHYSLLPIYYSVLCDQSAVFLITVLYNQYLPPIPTPLLTQRENHLEMYKLNVLLFLLIFHYASPLSTPISSFTSVVRNRYACGRFQPSNDLSVSLPLINQALSEAVRAPSGFNAQPSRFVVISTPESKSLASNFACGRNSDRILQV